MYDCEELVGEVNHTIEYVTGSEDMDLYFIKIIIEIEMSKCYINGKRFMSTVNLRTNLRTI